MLQRGVVVLSQSIKSMQTPRRRLLFPVVAGAAMAVACHSGTWAAPPRAVYILSDNDGYGLSDCISQKWECGKIVADSWCEAHGHGRALAFGGAEDVTGAIAADKPSTGGAAMVSCAD
jgi:hypothetical protein